MNNSNVKNTEVRSNASKLISISNLSISSASKGTPQDVLDINKK